MSEAAIYIQSKYGTAVANGGADSDITEAQATTGVVQTWTRDLKCQSNVGASQVKAWLDTDHAAGIEISTDGAGWVSPKGKMDNRPAAALDFADVPAGSSITVHFRRTIAAGAVADPDIFVVLYLSAHVL